MKRNILAIILGGLIIVSSCHDLDLTPLDKGSSGNWYSTQVELEMSINDLYRIIFWPVDGARQTDWSDDYTNREVLVNFENATLNSQDATVKRLWERQYKVIARANGIISNAERALQNGASKSFVERVVAEAHFHRGAAYYKLLSKFGDLPLVDSHIDVETALTMGRTDKQTVLKFAYDDFDAAAAVLPTSYTGQKRATKGAALALKARLALYMNDWTTAAQAAKTVIDLDVYKLHENYSELFLVKAINSPEPIFYIPRTILSSDNEDYIRADWVRDQLPRNISGWGSFNPSWDLFASYVCTDGLPIDESPLFDPADPFKNRDPRLSMTIVPFGSEWLGYEYNPHPKATKVMNYTTGQMVNNQDSRAVAQYASYTGLLWKKGIDITWTQNGFLAEPDLLVIRYADVLLMYAEAKIELNDIDQSVLDAMNEVRARAYGVNKSETNRYPAFTSKNQSELRIQLRTERRMEFAKENLRYMDLIRWRYSEIVMKRKGYGMLYPTSKLISEVVDKGEWFWPYAPDIDENGLPDFSKLENAGKILPLTQRQWDDRQYLWPIPSTEIQINDNMKQNPGY